MRDGCAVLADETPLAELARRIEERMGLHYPPAKERELAAALRRMSAAQGFARELDCARWLLAGEWNAARTALCARFLTIGETYFFREPRALDLVASHARERLAAGATGIRIWSAGCCTGEEPYSIAMTLREKLPQLAPGQVSILATDLNDAFLDFARAGEYRRWSFRRTPPALQQAYFEPAAGGRLRIGAALRGQVRFAQLNLALPLYPAAASGTQGMDIIFCRNVLMYFSREQMTKVVARFHACLADGGWLVVNPSEASSELFAGFAPVYFPDAVFFRKLAPAMAVAAEVAPPAHTDAGGHGPARSARGGASRTAGARGARARTSAAPVRAAVPSVPAAAAPHLEAGAVPAHPGAHADTLARAQSLARLGQPDAALQCLARAAEAAPLAAELHQAAALIALDRGDAALARQHLRRLLYLQPDNALAQYLCAVTEHDAGRCASARRLLESCDALLARAAGGDQVPGADGWQAAGLRESVRTWLERVR